MAEEKITPETPSNPKPTLLEEVQKRQQQGTSLVDEMRNRGLMKSPANIVNGQPVNIDINNNLIGDYSSGPTPGAKNGLTQDYSKSFNDYLSQADTWAKDKYFWGKSYAYGAGINDMNFERYYSHPKFKQFGFSPYRDNEAHYNQNGSAWDDTIRAGTQFLNLVGTGAASVLPWVDSSDSEQQMRKAMAIGQSSRGGATGFMTNLGLNSAYTIGLLSEMAVENAAALALSPFTGGASEVAEIGKDVYNAKKLFNVFSGAKSLRNTVNSLRDFSKAKDVWEGTKAAGKAASNLIAPNLTELFSAGKEVNQLTNYAKTFKTAGAFYKDVREMNLAYSEAALEGKGAAFDLNTKLIADYYKEHGQLPEGKDAEEIYNKSVGADNLTKWLNVGAIYLTNKLVFDNSFKGWRSLSKTKDELSAGLSGVLKGGDAAWKAKGLTSPWELGEKTLKGGLKSSLNPMNISRGTARYLVGNLAEGLQESAQEVISGGAKDYYHSLADNATHSGKGEHLTLLDAMGRNINKQFSGQGLETFASGLLMGALVQPIQTGVYKYGSQALSKIADSQGYEEAKRIRKEFSEKVLASMNEVASDPAKLFDQLNENLAVQSHLGVKSQESVEAGDKKTYIDLQNEALYNHLHTIMRSGKTGLLQDHLADMKKLPDEELKTAFGQEELSASEIRGKIDSMLSDVDYLQKRFDTIDKKFQNPFNPNKYNLTKEQDKYVTEQLRYNAYEKSKKMAVFSAYSFDKTLERMQKIQEKLSSDKPLSKASASDFTSLLNKSDLQNQIKNLTDEVGLLKTEEGADAEYNQKQEKLDALKALSEHFDVYKMAMIAAHREQLKPEEAEKLRKTMAVKVGAKVRSLSGEEGVVKQVRGRNITLSSGKTFKRHRVEIIKSPKEVEQEYVQHYLGQATDEMRGAYHDYVKTVAKQNDDYVFNDKVNESFDDLKDFYSLHEDSKNLSQAVNVLHDPKGFMDFASIMEEVNRGIYESRQKLLGEAYRKYLDMKDTNGILNDLHNIGVWVDAEDIKDLREKKVIPKRFFTAGTPHEEISSDNPKYQEAEQLIKDYVDATKPEGFVEEKSEQALPTQTATGTIRIIRHGETVEDEKGINSGPTQEHITPEGAKHVEEGAEGKVDATLTKIIVSSRQRAKDSAEVVAKGKDIEIVENAALDPWNTGDEKTGFAEIPDEDWHKFADWFATHPEEKIYAGEDAELKEKYSDRQLTESFNEFKDRVLNALPEITNGLGDGGAIMTHSNVIQLIKAYIENGSKNDANLGVMFVKNEPSKNGEFIEFQRQQVNPSFAETKQQAEEAHAAAIEKFDLPGRLAAVKDEDELEALEVVIKDAIREGALPAVDTWYKYVTDAVEAKYIELFANVDISTLKKGDVVTLKNPKMQNVMIVNVSKESGDIEIAGHYKEKNAPIIGKDTFIKKDDILYTAHMKAVPKTTVTPEEKTLIKTNQEKTTDFTQDVNRLKQVADAAEKKTTAQVTADFLNNLGCK